MAARSVGIIGGGVSGLTAAYELAKRGIPVTIYERSEELGGLAASIPIGDSLIDRYYHFVCGADHDLMELAAELDLTSRLHWAPARTAYYVNGRMYGFSTPADLLRFRPLSLSSKLRFGLHILRAKRMKHWKPLEALTAVDWLRREIGEQAYDTIWQPLLQIKFGAQHDQVSATWLWHRLWRVTQSRHNVFAPEHFGYFDGGSGTLIAALRDRVLELGGQLRLSTTAQCLTGSASEVTGLVTGEGPAAHDAIISTVALPVLADILPQEAISYRRELERVQFVGIVCVLLCLKHKTQNAYWVNVNDPGVPFNGYIEYSSLNPWSPDGTSRFIYVPFYMPTSDPRYCASDDAMVADVAQGLQRMYPGFSPQWIEYAVVSRSTHAQAICPAHFSESLPDIKSPLRGLYVVDSTQLYPSDRCISGMVNLARQAASAVADFG